MNRNLSITKTFLQFSKIKKEKFIKNKQLYNCLSKNTQYRIFTSNSDDCKYNCKCCKYCKCKNFITPSDIIGGVAVITLSVLTVSFIVKN
jgi:hypothetical protein